MVKHNNMLPNVHLRTEWQKHVKTWFDQPSRKLRRRKARLAKAKRVAPRPLSMLRPAVHPPTVRYNMKVRAGRGFTLEELKEAGINRQEARGIGIAVDHRRRNRSNESLRTNVKRLLEYKSKLLIFPRKPHSKRAKQGDSSKEELSQAVQVTTKHVLPVRAKQSAVKPRAITEEDRNVDAYLTVRKARLQAAFVGVRERRRKAKEEKAKTDAMKAGAASQ